MRNYKMYELLTADEDESDRIVQLFEFVRANDTFLGNKGKRLVDMKYGEVAEIKVLVKNAETFKAFEKVFGVSEDKTLKARCDEFFPAKNYIKEQIKFIADLEKENLTGKPDYKLEKAGVNKLNVLGDNNVAIDLGKQFACKPSEIMEWTYMDVFMVLLKNKIDHEISEAYAKD